MRNIIFVAVVLLILPVVISAQEGYRYHHVPLSQVKITDAFWSPRLNAHRNGTIPSAITQVRDSTDRIQNFEIAAGVKKGQYQGLVWDDSDVYKVMEGIAYSLQLKRDPELEGLMDGWIDVFAKAQRKDGYLNTFFILSQQDDGLGRNLGRWSDMGRHEMYCAGHLIEAAIAYENATGKKKFLEVAVKFADHLLDNFGPYKRRWVPLHQEVELALVKLYHATNERKYLEFASWLFEERGKGREAGPMWDNGPKTKGIDCQTDVPVKELTGAWGHAVRAMYMYSGMLDVGVAAKDQAFINAVDRAWKDAIPDKLYVTGGVGSRREGEAFGEKFELPNKEAYCETCSSVGMVLWTSRMNDLYGDAKYADVLEQTLYNALLAGGSLDGRKFFYTNPLESDGNHHRGEKYGIACCPSNMARFVPTVGRYIYSQGNDALLVNLYVGSEAKVKLNNTNIVIKQQTAYPFEGNVSLEIQPEQQVEGQIKLRIPSWCGSYKLTVNNKKITNEKTDGYISLNKLWKAGDKISLTMDMPVKLVESDERVVNNAGKRAVQRGPLVYCLEQVDNAGVDLEKVTLTPSSKFKVLNAGGALQGLKKIETSAGSTRVTFVPYFAWENRDSGKMLVWVNYANN